MPDVTNPNWIAVALAAIAMLHSVATTAAVVVIHLAQLRAGLPLTPVSLTPADALPPAPPPAVKP